MTRRATTPGTTPRGERVTAPRPTSSPGHPRRAAAPAKHAPHARRAPFVLLILALLGGGLCALLALNTASAANEISRRALADKDQSVSDQLVELQNRAQASAAPSNLAAAARRLGMVPAGNPGFLEVGTDGQVQVVGRPAVASSVPLPATHTAKKTAKKTATTTPTSTATTTAGRNATSTSTAGRSAHPTSTGAGRSTSKPGKRTQKTSTRATHPTGTTPPTTANVTIPGGAR